MPRTNHELDDEVITFIREFTAEKGYPPTVGDIADHFNYSSRSVIYARLSRLRKSGIVDWTPRTYRTLRVIDPPI